MMKMGLFQTRHRIREDARLIRAAVRGFVIRVYTPLWSIINITCTVLDPVWLQRLRGSNPGQLERRPAPRVWDVDIRPAVEQDLHDTDRFMEFN